MDRPKTDADRESEIKKLQVFPERVGSIRTREQALELTPDVFTPEHIGRPVQDEEFLPPGVQSDEDAMHYHRATWWVVPPGPWK